jgi:hypothetical protein
MNMTTGTEGTLSVTLSSDKVTNKLFMTLSRQATGVQSRLSHGQTTAICSVSYGLQARLAPMNVIDGAYRQITFVNTLRGGLASTAPKAPKLTGSTQCLITARWRKTKSYDTELRTLM